MRLNANCSTPHVLKLSRSEGISGSPVRLYVTMSEIVQPERVLNDCVGARVNEHGSSFTIVYRYLVTPYSACETTRVPCAASSGERS